MPIEFIPTGERTRMRDNWCPYCGSHHNAATASSANPESLPEPGCIAICLDCGAVLTYDAAMKLVVPTAEELAEMQSDREVWAVVMEMSAKFKQREAIKLVLSSKLDDDFARRKM